MNHENWHKSYYVDLFYLLTIEKQVIAKAGETSGSRTALFFKHSVILVPKVESYFSYVPGEIWCENSM